MVSRKTGGMPAKRIDAMFSRKLLFLLLMLINIAAVLVGVYYYSDQLASTALPLLIFVPDCPLYVFLALLIIAKIVRNDAFSVPLHTESEERGVPLRLLNPVKFGVSHRRVAEPRYVLPRWHKNAIEPRLVLNRSGWRVR